MIKNRSLNPKSTLGFKRKKMRYRLSTKRKSHSKYWKVASIVNAQSQMENQSFWICSPAQRKHPTLPTSQISSITSISAKHKLRPSDPATDFQKLHSLKLRPRMITDLSNKDPALIRKLPKRITSIVRPQKPWETPKSHSLSLNKLIQTQDSAR